MLVTTVLLFMPQSLSFLRDNNTSYSTFSLYWLWEQAQRPGQNI